MGTAKTTLRYFRNVAIIEGISTILLFFVAMPLKYFAGMPLAVTYMGWIHGILFVAYAYLLVMCWDRYKWAFKRVATYFGASLIPFAPFFVEHKLRREG
ncbi:DUF3817 domain-containing protein [Parapedobacter sp.]